jgi:hypothetical protein
MNREILNMSNEKANELRQKAAELETRRNESFERCDTDGFVSQWASGLRAEELRTQAEIEENGGKATFWGLYEGDRRVIAKLISVTNPRTPWKTNRVWLVDENDPVAVKRKFIPEGENSRVQKSLGLSERRELQTAKAGINGLGTGLSGSAWVEVYRTGDQWGREATLA